MADNKKYYYMRLKENYFDSSEISLLESMPGGYLYSNILLKLYLRSLRGEGRLAIRRWLDRYKAVVHVQKKNSFLFTIASVMDMKKSCPVTGTCCSK